MYVPFAHSIDVENTHNTYSLVRFLYSTFLPIFLISKLQTWWKLVLTPTEQTKIESHTRKLRVLEAGRPYAWVRSLSSTARQLTCPRICLVGLDQDFQGLILSLIPAARILGFPTSDFSADEIDSDTWSLLNDLFNDRERPAWGKCCK